MISLAMLLLRKVQVTMAADREARSAVDSAADREIRLAVVSMVRTVMATVIMNIILKTVKIWMIF